MALLLVVLAAYQPAWRGGFLWDDDHHVTPAALQSLQGLERIWTDIGATQQYYPVVHTAFWLEHRIWGDDVLGYHLVSLSLHALSAFLVAVLLTRLGVPGATLAAVLFALHPVHVESVAWISELKNTLSAVLYLLAMLAYVEFDRTRRSSTYALACLLFVLALGSKTVTATLPVALAVIFWWKRGRLDLRRDIYPLVPLLVVGIGSGLLTAWVERHFIGAEGAPFALSWIERALLAGRALWFYAGKLLWPAHLAFTYPRWAVDQTVWWQYLFPLAALMGFVGLWLLRGRSRAPLAVGLLFAGTLAPALGFVDVYPFRFSYVADHFQYLASIPVLAGASALLVTGRGPLRRLARPAVLAVVIGGVLGFLTFTESRSYASAITLYRETIRRNPRAWIAHSNLGGLLLDSQPAEARQHIEEALRLEPDLAEAHNNLGILQHRDGRLAEALASYDRAIALEPGLARAHNNRCAVLRQLGRPLDALAACDRALAIDPDYVEAHYNKGAALQVLGDASAAAAEFERAVALDPAYANALYQLGLVRHRAGRLDEAIAYYRAAVDSDPGFAEAFNDLGLALVMTGQRDAAVSAFSRALVARPGFTAASFNLANVLVSLGRLDEATGRFEAVLAANPDDGTAHNNLGVTLMRLGRFAEAAEHFREALRVDPGSAEAAANLREARARGGR